MTAVAGWGRRRRGTARAAARAVARSSNARSNDRDDDRGVQGALDAVDQMVDIVDGLEDYILHSDTVKRHGTRYRLNLLWVHAFAALCMAPLLAATGRDGMTGPSFAFLRTVPGAPFSIAVILGVGGLILGLGCVFRAKRTEIAGLLCLGMFYVLFGASFTVVPVRWLLEEQATKPPLYSPIVYGHLAVIMIMHIRALITALRDDIRKSRRPQEAGTP